MDEIHDEIADIIGLETALGGRLSSLRRRREKLKRDLVELGKSERLVTDHALIRYLQRHKGIDVDAMRDELRALADGAAPAKDGEHFWHPSGVIMIIGNEGQIVTVLSPEQSEKWDGRKLKNGARMLRTDTAQKQPERAEIDRNET